MRDLSAGYEGKEVLTDVNLTIHEHDFLGIIGPNGGGKTTLIRCILGLLKPTKGEIQYADDSLIKQIGYLPQYNSVDRRFPISVEEVVLSGLLGGRSLTKRYTAAERQQAHKVIAQMGLEGLEKRAIGELSGGQLQRAMLGRALIAGPRLLILDEPGTYLDRQSSGRLYQILEEISSSCAIVLVSHDVGTVLRQVKNVACVDGTLHYHAAAEVDAPWLEAHLHCPIEMVGHGHLPHRVLHRHE
ncbi:MAG: ABC transporter ATP-binding protein [Bacteroides sp.]|nr:ABC transporter ATP-binding protein [Bacteroides sp.]